ncbi:MAG: hypothetical protein GY861_10340 [bacterium]|nr:hypothetical protein [bacterium]
MKIFKYAIQYISLLAVGFGVGWLTGLSISPVVSTLLTSIVGVVIALVSILSGIKAPESTTTEHTEQVQNNFKWRADPLPLAFLMIGIIGGASVGIIARTHNWLGVVDERPNIQAEIQRWKAVGIEEEKIANRLFDLEYPLQKASIKKTDDTKNQPALTVLFEGSHEECLRLSTTPDSKLKKNLAASSEPIFNPLPSLIEDTALLRKVVESQCDALGKI